MKGLSLWQPWASAMAKGHKSVETRSWPTGYRGELVICSAVVRPKRADFESDKVYRMALGLPYGCALCVVELYDCIPSDQVVYRLGTILFEREKEWGDYTPGRFGWLTRRRRTLRQPVPITGRQGLWNLTDDIVAKIKEQLP